MRDKPEGQQETMPAGQHVAYFDDGQFHWMSGIAPRNCEFYTRPSEQAVTEEWREIKQHVQPRITDGYTAVAISKPGYWFVKGPGPSASLKAAMEAGHRD